MSDRCTCESEAAGLNLNCPFHGVPAGLLSFAEFSLMNLKRHQDWPRINGGGQIKVTSQEWTISDWAVAVAEETGEICGKVKRLNRLRSGHIMNRKEGSVDSEEEAILAIKKEIGDVCTYLDLLAQEGLGSTLEECLRLAYNGVSQRENLPHRI